MHYIGIDFGTSNSLASLVKNNKIEFVKYPDGNISNPTILYFPEKSKQHFIGNDGVHHFLHNLEEYGIGGRLMLSVKSLLPDAKFEQTLVSGHGNQTVEMLVAKFLTALKKMAEAQLSQNFEGVVLGRPVQFNELAVERLEKAAKLAGFKKVIFWLEPVAAALAYETTAVKDELVCVVDIGGGTSDICVIETSPKRSDSPDRLNDIKAVSGVYQAGDELSTQIMMHKLAPKFGAGSTFKSLGKEMPFPAHIIGKLSKWHRINLLQDQRDQAIISSILPFSNHPENIERLLQLIKHYYGFELFQSIDTAKKHLSTHDQTAISFSQLNLRENISVAEFERMIAGVAHKIEKSIFDCLTMAGTNPQNINRVILTGGSSQVPLINRAVIKIFGAEKILRPDFFSSVATGLGFVSSRFN